jgi:hypothetical protein
MSLGQRTFAFCVGATVGAFILSIVATIRSEDLFTDAALPIVGISLGVGGLCLLTTWIGFALAQSLKHVPSRKYCAGLGVLFVCGSGSVFFFLDGGVIHALGAFIALAMIVFVAPLTALVGSFFVKTDNLIANPTIEVDAQKSDARPSL